MADIGPGLGPGEESEDLAGGLAHPGRVKRYGDTVIRPAGPHAPTIHALLRHVRAAGFAGAPEPLGLTDDGQERLSFIPGDVALPPFPPWSQAPSALAGVGRLLRCFHEATRSFTPSASDTWSGELADPDGGGEVIAHNDVCPENVVFRAGEAVGLIDYDFAAPGRAVWDLAMCARMWVPLVHPEEAALDGGGRADPAILLRALCDGYGLGSDVRAGLLDVVAETARVGAEFVHRRAEAGEAPFIEMRQRRSAGDGALRFDGWLEAERSRLTAALLAAPVVSPDA